MESFVFFCSFRYQFETFFIWKKEPMFSGKPTGQQMRAMLSVLNILINEVCQKFDKNCLKLLKSENFGIFVIFGVNFLLQNRIYFFIEDYWRMNSCLVERFQHSNSRCLSKKLPKEHKNI